MGHVSHVVLLLFGMIAIHLLFSEVSCYVISILFQRKDLCRF